MKYVGFVGWRGLVGSVLINRMQEKNNFCKIHPIFFSTSQYGKYVPIIKNKINFIYNAFDLDILIELDIIISCQGNDYTKIIHKKLRDLNWNGYWIDSASFLRMKSDSCIALDPINRKLILKKISQGCKNFIGGNCSVNLMLISLGRLFYEDLIEWISVSTYQAATGAGSKYVRKLLFQINKIHFHIKNELKDLNFNVLQVEKKIFSFSQKKKYLEFDPFVFAYNIIPWIGSKIKNSSQSSEEKKYQQEVNKILNLEKIIPIDSTCVRVGSLRSHSQLFTIKLKKNISLKEIKRILCENNIWVKIIPNDPFLTMKNLTPMKVSGSLNILIGRIRKLNIGKKYLSIFSIGDQLIWGAAEPLRLILLELI
ncbi:asd [Wigglesworthia glossinidia endosymbiont of Glossina brevipalpis]|uniref:Aspartate-semialdehyde dehydrogenase n=1 Tax=Wigglesworthia glossinidia brevipalpis TaxID=36870 RepID=Q8D2B1_WIGBR|nr:asd [Wigglesworthia glossinidia endosymbiont of Glossina brevipalpis]